MISHNVLQNNLILKNLINHSLNYIKRKTLNWKTISLEHNTILKNKTKCNTNVKKDKTIYSTCI